MRMWIWTCLEVVSCVSLLVQAATLVQPEWGYYFDQDDQGPGTYTFGYDIEDPGSRNVQFRREKRLPNGTVTGSYGLVEPDGNIRIVHYAADSLGYRAVIENSQRDNENHPLQTAGKRWGKPEEFWNFLWYPNGGYRQSSALNTALQSLKTLGNPVLEERTPPVYQGTGSSSNHLQKGNQEPSTIQRELFSNEAQQSQDENLSISESNNHGIPSSPGQFNVPHKYPEVPSAIDQQYDRYFGSDSSADQSQNYPSFLPAPYYSHFGV